GGIPRRQGRRRALQYRAPLVRAGETSRQRQGVDCRARRQETAGCEGHLPAQHHAIQHDGPWCAHRYRVDRSERRGTLMLRSEKESAVKELQDRFTRMSSAVFLDYGGMSVEEVGQLRDTFRAKGVEYKVVKNTLVRKALADQTWVGDLSVALRGMTGVAWSFEEPSAAARVVKDFVKQNEKLKIKAGVLDGQVLDAKAVENQLASLPSKDEARAQLLATMMAPAQSFVRLL